MNRFVKFLLPLACLFLFPVHAYAAEQNSAIGICDELMTATSTPPATVKETALGDLTADAVRNAAGTDFAVVTADCFFGNLQPGDVTAADIDLILDSTVTYNIISVTPADLNALMEEAVSHTVLDESYAINIEQSASGDFLQISGFSVQYDPNMLPGGRVKSITIGGSEPDLSDDSTLYTMAVPSDFSGTSNFPVTETTEITAASAVIDYISACGHVSPPETERLHAIAVRDNDFINQLPIGLIAFAAIVAVICGKAMLRMRAENER